MAPQKLVKQITNVRHGVAVIHRHLIELRVILLILVLEDMFQACALEFGGYWNMFFALTEFL